MFENCYICERLRQFDMESSDKKYVRVYVCVSGIMKEICLLYLSCIIIPAFVLCHLYHVKLFSGTAACECFSILRRTGVCPGRNIKCL